MRTLTKAQLDKAHDLCRNLPLIHAELMEAGLILTAHKMHEVVRQSGYELADLKSKEAK